VFDLAGLSGSCRLKIARYGSSYSNLDRMNGDYLSHNSCCHCKRVEAQSPTNEEHAIASFDCVGGWHELSEHLSPTCPSIGSGQIIEALLLPAEYFDPHRTYSAVKVSKGHRFTAFFNARDGTDDHQTQQTLPHADTTPQGARCWVHFVQLSSPIGSDSNMRALCPKSPALPGNLGSRHMSREPVRIPD
jgi:hypothetical protein